MKRNNRLQKYRKQSAFFTGCLFILATWWASPLSAQQEIVRLPARELAVEKLIGEIESQTPLIIGVNHRNFDVSRIVRFDTDRIPAGLALDRIVEGTGHTYLLRGKHVMIVRKETPAPVRPQAVKRDTVRIEVPFLMEEGTITLRENEKHVVEPVIREFTTIEFGTEQEVVFAVRTPGERNKVRIENLSIGRIDEGVDIGFTVTAEAEAVDANQSLTITPVLRDKSEGGAGARKLQPLALKGKKYILSMQRRAKSRGTAVPEDGAVRLRNGEAYTYRQRVPVSAFGSGTVLEFECDAADCHRYSLETVQTGAAGFVNHFREITIPEPPPGLTTGDRLALDYAFVEHDPGGDVSVIRPDRQQALMVYYHLDKYDLRYDYRNNNRTLSQMIAAINIIRESSDSEITHVVLSGYASPEGPLQRNDMLAGNRVATLRNFLTEHTGLPQNAFIMHNGGSDWEGLNLLVRENRFPGRDEVLEILENAPAKDRMGRIRRLGNGAVFQYMLEHLLPDLRNAAYIKVYYRNK